MITFNQRVLSQLFIMLFILLGTNMAYANKITPSHVYQAVDNVANELLLLHKANESEAKLTGFKMENRRPRHVLQKAREVFQKLQILRDINGLTQNPVPDFPTKEITPDNVLEMISAIHSGVRELREPFGVEEAAAEAEFIDGKKPNDVYLNLVRVGEMIESLDIPPVVPNDVYQIAETILGDIELIRNHRGITNSVYESSGSSAKSPKNVYQQARGLLSSIKSLCNKDSVFCLPGNVMLPPYHEGNIKPVHVLDILNNTLAELGSTKTKLQLYKTTVMAEAPSGKTPSNVYDVVTTARNMIETIY